LKGELTNFGQMFIVLLGYMGAGKTTVGRLLADHMSIPFIDLDQIIEANDDRSILEIFQMKGEAYFRRLEALYLESILQLPKGVLSTGGGTPIFGDNMELIKSQSTSVYLKWSEKALAERLINELDHRPILKDLDEYEIEEFIQTHLAKRAEYYEQANFIIDCDNKSVQEITVEIIRKIS
jgi:shikimate kinase